MRVPSKNKSEFVNLHQFVAILITEYVYSLVTNILTNTQIKDQHRQFFSEVEVC